MEPLDIVKAHFKKSRALEIKAYRKWHIAKTFYKLTPAKCNKCGVTFDFDYWSRYLIDKETPLCKECT